MLEVAMVKNPIGMLPVIGSAKNTVNTLSNFTNHVFLVSRVRAVFVADFAARNGVPPGVKV